MDKILDFIPSGGLANRMRALASAYNLYLHTGVKIHAVWFADWGLRASFASLFEPLHLDGITLREACWMDKYTIDRPRRKNFHIPALYRGIVYKRQIRENRVDGLKKKEFDFDAWALSSGRKIMDCYSVFGKFDNYDALIQQLFHPVSAVMEKVNRNVTAFSDYTIGVHIRRTDNAESIRESPLEAFVKVIDEELLAHPSLKIFLATDADDVKQNLRERYGSRVMTAESTASRESIEGIRDGLVDMWTLAACQIIYGSVGSSFSVMASNIGSKPLVMVKK